MTTTGWTWADLTDDQLQKVATAEQTLGVDILLVYQPNSQTPIGAGGTQPQGLQAAPLTESQLECLRGLESHIGAVVVAYASQ
jgi:hypothetical protein